ncbi:MAG: DNA mismatch repair protein MutS, partial [Erysipelotrichaceae bacterium]|nr:DNA mismatch repair protein MutS [Erysipelotrichaceae bacterium]
YLAAVIVSGWDIHILYCELSTGHLRYQRVEKSPVALQKALTAEHVSEVVCDRQMDKRWIQALEERGWIVSRQKKSALHPEDADLMQHEDTKKAEDVLALLMGYLDQTQKQHIDHFLPIESMNDQGVLIMDAETKNHLDLTQKENSLWSFMDRCCCVMGSRLLRRWIEAPLMDAAAIAKRQQAVARLKNDFLLREQLKEHLIYIYDMERLASRIAYGNAGPRDVLQLLTSLEHAEPILQQAQAVSSYPEWKDVPTCQDLYRQLQGAIVEEPPVTMKDGGIFQEGYNETLDQLRHIAQQGKDFILELEAKERQRTGIKSLKIGYNRVFGYYIEVRNTNLEAIREEFGYHPKQTLANATRFITSELKEKEDQILHAQEQKVALELELFAQLLAEIKERLFDLHQCAKALATIDVLYALAVLADDQGYICPQFHPQRSVCVREGKHPILAATMKEHAFVSNDWIMEEPCHIQIITGPNMGGKSTYMRQNALLVVMAQMGSFIPAKEAVLPIFDRIFTRIGASDDILSGKSTFMVEMMEANEALRKASANSLILLDEIGRGTATYDGMALAQAMLEYIDSAIQAKSLFSTHYHELTQLEQDHPSVQNVHVDVKEEKGEIEFRYRVVPGKADKSYGINVARLAKLPKVVLERAGQLLKEYEGQHDHRSYQPNLFVMESAQPEKNELIERLQNLDVDEMSPKEALDCLYELKKKSKTID